MAENSLPRKHSHRNHQLARMVVGLWDAGKSSREIAEELGYCQGRIAAIISTQPEYQLTPSYAWPPSMCKSVINLYDSGLSVSKIGAKFNTDGKSVCKILRHYHICKRPNVKRGSWTGTNNPRWNNGSVIRRGYRYLSRPDHPNATKQGYVLEHRLVMEEHLGRYLTPIEVVHHKNDNRLDNRIENLQLFANNGDHIRETVHRSTPTRKEQE